MGRKPLSTDEDRLVRRIAGVGDALPAPDPVRLNAIEDRLGRALPPRGRTRHVPVWYWWLIGALAVSGAAAWWAGDHFFGGASFRVTPDETRPATNEPVNREIGEPRQEREDASAESPSQSGDPRSIYRRERF